MCAMVHLTLKQQLSASIRTAYFKCFPLFLLVPRLPERLPLGALFPLQHRRNIFLPREPAGGQMIVYIKKKRGGQSKTQLLHPEGHLETSNGQPSFCSGCRGPVDTLHGAGAQQTRMPRHRLVWCWLQICKKKHKSSTFLFNAAESESNICRNIPQASERV